MPEITLRTVYDCIDWPFKEEGPIPDYAKVSISVGWEHFYMAVRVFERLGVKPDNKHCRYVVYLNDDGLHLVKIEKPKPGGKIGNVNKYAAIVKR